MCPKCSSKQKFQGCRQRTIHLGSLGEFCISRAYYTCSSSCCGYGEYPLDRLLGLSQNRAGGKFEEQICILSAHMPFEQVREYLEDFEQTGISETMVRKTAETCGAALLRREEELSRDLKHGRIEALRQPTKSNSILFVQADGSMVPTRGQKAGKNGKKCVEYRENKLGLLFRNEDLQCLPNASCRIEKKKFVSSLGKGVGHFEDLLKKAAYESGSRNAREIVFISDGAEWLDQLRERLFPDSVHVLDWYHAVEHLHDCAKEIFGESASDKINAWVEPRKTLLWEGKAPELCMNLLAETMERSGKAASAVKALHSYYFPRLEKLNYPSFRRKGYFIGSGAVESANKYLVQQRLKQAGMKWNIDGASAVLQLRQKVYERTWRETWDNRAVNFSYK